MVYTIFFFFTFINTMKEALVCRNRRTPHPRFRIRKTYPFYGIIVANIGAILWQYYGNIVKSRTRRCLGVTKDLPISPRFAPYDFLSRCKFSTLTTRQPMVGFYLLPFPRFPLRKKEHKSYFGKNRTYDFRTSRSAGNLLDHSKTIYK